MKYRRFVVLRTGEHVPIDQHALDWAYQYGYTFGFGPLRSYPPRDLDIMKVYWGGSDMQRAEALTIPDRIEVVTIPDMSAIPMWISHYSFEQECSNVLMAMEGMPQQYYVREVCGRTGKVLNVSPVQR